MGGDKLDPCCYPEQVDERVVRILTRTIWAAVAGSAVGALAGWGVAQFLHVPAVDMLTEWQPKVSTQVYAADGRQVATFALERRIELKPEEIPNHVKLAIVAIEDANFYRHGGVDPTAILRAALGSARTLRLGGTGGGSTITQQLALHLFLKREHSLQRKVREALLALDIEKRYSKDQILTWYANLIFFGHGANGVEAASRLYFAKPAKQLTLAEAAMLAGMIPSPSKKFDPIVRPEATLERRNKVLDRMLELGFVDRDAHATATAEPLRVALHREPISTGAYFVEMVRQEIEQKYTTEDLYEGGLKVHLTMDFELQRAAERALRDGLVALDQRLGYRRPVNVVTSGLAESPGAYEDPSWQQLELEAGGLATGVVQTVDAVEARVRIGERTARLPLARAEWTQAASLSRILRPGDLVLVRLPDPLPEDATAPLEVSLLQRPEIEGAILVMDSSSGAILAQVGGFDFAQSEFNRAVQAVRQCGSAFKPFVYLTAFQQGYTPADLLFDAPFLLPNSRGELKYCPRNYYNRYYGITTIRRALELSFNATAVKMQQLVGGAAVVETAKRFGISTNLAPYPSLALGSFEVRLVDLVRAYAGIATLGELPQPYFITEVYDRDGKLKEQGFPHSERVVPAPVAYLMANVLRGVVQRGTGAEASKLGVHLAGKTGTTDDYTDAWFVGFSPRITVGVWVGRDLKTPIGSRMTGAEAALPIWIRFMESYIGRLSQAERDEDFPVPAGVVFTPVDLYTGRRATPEVGELLDEKGRSRLVLEAFLDGTEPTQTYDPALARAVELPWPYQEPYYVPRPGEPMPTQEAVAIADGRIRG